jgi:Undecaprenyl-phosphate glucose phosphotransferase
MMSEILERFPVESQVISNSETLESPAPNRLFAGRLRPAHIEVGALIGDVAVILLSSLLSGVVYKLLVVGISFKGLGLLDISALTAINFALINVARHDYKLKKLLRTDGQARELIMIWAITCGMLAVAGFTMKISGTYSRGASIFFVVSSPFALLVWRMALARFILRSLARDNFAKKKIIVISEKHRAASSKSLAELRRHGYVPVNVCYLTDLEMASSGASSSFRAKLDRMVDLARRERVDGFYILIGWNYHRAIDVVLNALNTLAVPLYLLPDESAARFMRTPVVEIGNTWTVPLKRLPLSQFEMAVKRSFDLCGSLLGLIALAPLLLMTALLIKIDSQGPVFFRQQRNGFNGHSFRIFKFRTMQVLEDQGEVRQATVNDKRITRLGRWLRRTSIDEIPQLLNVLFGEMSLVGPRPHACSHDSKYEKLIAHYAFRHHMKPGLTGWAQVNGYRGETPRIELMERRVDHDLWYINNWSLSLDIRIALKTLLVTLFQRSAY